MTQTCPPARMFWRRALATTALVICASSGLISSREAAGNAPAAKAAPPESSGILVAFKQPAPRVARMNALSRAGVMLDRKVESPFFSRVVLTPGARAAGLDTKAVLRQLRSDPAVRVAEPDYIQRVLAIPNDTRFDELWGLHNTGQNGGTPDADIDAPEAWDRVQGSDTIVVAVIDTGVDYNHEDLTQNILRDANNRVVGFDYVNGDADPMDDHDHGTHCAGTIGGRGNNASGVTGVNWRVKIIPLKFLAADGFGNLSAAIQCIDFARNNGARVMSNSWGGGGYSQLLLEAIQRARNANILFVAAAGNNTENTDASPHYPSSYAVENVLSVGASDRNDQPASFSNFGAASVDLFAPGDSILSTIPNNAYASFNGTSMACPHVAGAAALVLAQFPTASVSQLIGRILGGVDRPAGFNGLCVTGGRLNVNNAVENDTFAPGAPISFRATHQAVNGMLLAWTTSGDDGSSGAASRLEIRYSTQVITPGNFASATLAAGAPAPLPSGSAQAYFVSGLDPNTSYHFAIRALDNVGNPSAIATAGPFRTLTVLCPLDDNVEGALRFTGQSPWGTTTSQSVSPTRSYTDSPAGAYGNNIDLSLTQSAAVAITGDASLNFKAKYDLESGFDYVYIEVSADNGTTWRRQSLVLNGSANWTAYTVPLASFQGQSIRVRFRFITDGSVTLDGVYLDDIKICIAETPCVFEETVEGAPQLSGSSPWAVTTTESFSPTHSYTDSPSGSYADSVDLSLSTNASPALTGMIPSLMFRAKTDLEVQYDYLYVEVSSNNGSTWQRQSLRLTGTSDWREYLIPLHDYLGQNLKVRFRLITDGSVVHDGVWLDDIRICGPALVPIVPDASVTVSSPNGGETWVPGTTQAVTWTSENVGGGVRIELSTNGGTTYSTLAPSTPNDGSESVTVPNTPSNQCRVRVSAVDNSGAADISNANFIIGEPEWTITVISPNGGETWQQGSTQAVTWTSQNVVGEVKIELSTNDGTSYTTLLANTPNDGSQSITVPGQASNQCRVRVSAVNNATCRDTSNGNFTIPAPGGGSPAFVLANGTLSPGSTGSIPLQFAANGGQVTAAGFDLLYDTTKITTLSAARGALPSGVDVQTSLVSPGRLRCLIFGVANRTSFSSGNVANVSVTAAAGIAGTSTQVRVVLPDTSSAGVQVTDPGGSIFNSTATASTIQFGLRGDLNGNGSVDVGDVQMIVNVFLGTATFVPALHDLNGNGGIDVGDIQQLVNLFLNVTGESKAAGISPDARVRPKTYRLNFNPARESISAMAFDLDLAGGQLNAVSLGLNRSDLQIAQNPQPDGRVRVLLFSITSTPIPRASGLFSIQVTGRRRIRIFRPDSTSTGADGARPDGSIVVLPMAKKANRLGLQLR